MAAMEHWFFIAVCLCCCVKLLLIPSYHSTDFEVHRNWLAITHSLPISDWYYEETSQWTLDYPPFFAWFEFTMSFVANIFDKDMLIVTNLNYSSNATILFQRLSVIVTDFILIFAVYKFVSESLNDRKKEASFTGKAFILTILILFNFGLFIVDHIHFQYNGFLFGILLLSIQKMTVGKMLQGAFLFALLLNFKHLFLYIAPSYFIYLLREYCFSPSTTKSRLAQLVGVNIIDLKPFRLLGLGTIVLSVFVVSFGPFIWMGDTIQVLSRLFPVQRGLCHAYWAANCWSLYNLGDKVLLIAVMIACADLTGLWYPCKWGTVQVVRYGQKMPFENGSKLGIIDNVTRQASMTGGLVAQQEHLVLPSISALITAVIAVLAMLPGLIRLWFKPSGSNGFIRSVILCAYCSFLFGYHVHEKAIIMVIIPFCLLAVQSGRSCRPFLLLSIPGNYALFPLLFQPFETPIKCILFAAYVLFSCIALAKLHRNNTWSFGIPFVYRLEAVYIWGLLPLHIYCNAIHSIIGLEKRLPFIPLMMTSVYCSIGIIWSWVLFYRDFLYQESKTVKVN